MIRLYGADPDHVPIVFTGLRPGEKLYEEPLASEEATKPTTPKSARACARGSPNTHHPPGRRSSRSPPRPSKGGSPYRYARRGVGDRSKVGSRK